MAQETYIDRLCTALTDVLERAATGSADRLAGYARNVDLACGHSRENLAAPPFAALS